MHKKNNLNSLVKTETCFKGPPKCYDLIITNCKHNFQNTLVLTSGFSDFHKMTVTVLKQNLLKQIQSKLIIETIKTLILLDLMKI